MVTYQLISDFQKPMFSRRSPHLNLNFFKTKKYEQKGQKDAFLTAQILSFESKKFSLILVMHLGATKHLTFVINSRCLLTFESVLFSIIFNRTSEDDSPEVSTILF